MLFVIYSGFYLNSSSIPDCKGGWGRGPGAFDAVVRRTSPHFGHTPPDAIWISYASFIRYGYQLLTHNEFHGLEFTCGNATLLQTHVSAAGERQGLRWLPPRRVAPCQGPLLWALL